MAVEGEPALGCRQNALSAKGVPRTPLAETLRRARCAPWPTLSPPPCPLPSQARPHPSHCLKSALRSTSPRALRARVSARFPLPRPGRGALPLRVRPPAGSPPRPSPAAGLGTAGTAVGVLRGSSERRAFQILPLKEWRRLWLWRWRWRGTP